MSTVEKKSPDNQQNFHNKYPGSKQAVVTICRLAVHISICLQTTTNSIWKQRLMILHEGHSILRNSPHFFHIH